MTFMMLKNELFYNFLRNSTSASNWSLLVILSASLYHDWVAISKWIVMEPFYTRRLGQPTSVDMIYR